MNEIDSRKTRKKRIREKVKREEFYHEETKSTKKDRRLIFVGWALAHQQAAIEPNDSRRAEHLRVRSKKENPQGRRQMTAGRKGTQETKRRRLHNTPAPISCAAIEGNLFCTDQSLK